MHDDEDDTSFAGVLAGRLSAAVRVVAVLVVAGAMGTWLAGRSSAPTPEPPAVVRAEPLPTASPSAPGDAAAADAEDTKNPADAGRRVATGVPLPPLRKDPTRPPRQVAPEPPCPRGDPLCAQLPR